MKYTYRHDPATLSEVSEMNARCILFYNHKRIRSKTEEAPLARRLST